MNDNLFTKQYICFYRDGQWEPIKELVRCKDCKWLKWVDANDEMVYCNLYKRCFPMDWFCADGERKE